MENNNIENEIEKVDNSSDLVDVIAQLKKENAASRELLKREKQEKKDLLEKVLNNEVVENPEAKEKRTDKQIAEEFLNNPQYGNRKMAELALEFRDNVIKEKGPSADPFVNQSEYSKPTQADYMEAEHIAEGLQYLVDNTEDDDDFAIEANRIFR